MNTTITIIAIALLTLSLAAFLANARRWRRMSRTVRICYATMIAALLPWTTASLLITKPPQAWTAAAFTVGFAATAVFIAVSLRDIRTERAELDRFTARIAAYLDRDARAELDLYTDRRADTDQRAEEQDTP